MHGRWVKNLLKGLNEIEIKYEIYEFFEENKIKLADILLFHATSKVVIFHQRVIQSKFITNHQSVYK